MMNPEQSRDSNLEAAFLKLIQEIEKAYRPLAKGLRIRIEKWIEKLVLTGSNIVWRKHRNAYARLLLDNVINKKLSEPFHALPPDGPLPSFPFHVQQQKGSSRDMLGPHESMFWRGLYHKMSEISEYNQQSHRSSGFLGEHPPFSTLDHANFSREISNLNLLIKEQKIKIQLLEQQLHEERSKHELEIQRLQHVQRLELARIIARANSFTGSSNSRYSPPTSPRHPPTNARPVVTAYNSNTTLLSASGVSLKASDTPPRYQQYPSSRGSSFLDAQSNNLSSRYQDFDRNRQSHQLFRDVNKSSGEDTADDVKGEGDQPLTSFTSLPDILPFPAAGFNNFQHHSYQQSVNSSHMLTSSDEERKVPSAAGVNSDAGNSRRSSRQSDIHSDAAVLTVHTTGTDVVQATVATSSSEGGNEEDDEHFLTYLEGFQARITEVQAENQQLTSSASSDQVAKMDLSANSLKIPQQDVPLDPSHPLFTSLSPRRHAGPETWH